MNIQSVPLTSVSFLCCITSFHRRCELIVAPLVETLGLSLMDIFARADSLYPKYPAFPHRQIFLREAVALHRCQIEHANELYL